MGRKSSGARHKEVTQLSCCERLLTYSGRAVQGGTKKKQQVSGRRSFHLCRTSRRSRNARSCSLHTQREPSLLSSVRREGEAGGEEVA